MMMADSSLAKINFEKVPGLGGTPSYGYRCPSSICRPSNSSSRRGLGLSPTLGCIFFPSPPLFLHSFSSGVFKALGYSLHGIVLIRPMFTKLSKWFQNNISLISRSNMAGVSYCIVTPIYYTSLYMPMTFHSLGFSTSLS